ncbi:hypothetical protein [Streptomyces sp. RP5T]|uniref:hypothetical protein n=1 Tax=Streptomyces sp. RP5T TaxID=2490848 RepID=UPI000F651CF3|nr:hypothetical protein [Streptomyces sp. RP5T]RRR81151.1 hypothetical protein EHS43_19705 [Streptomyces sp. RP5T]
MTVPRPEPQRLDELLLDGFRQVSVILDERKSTLVADPVLAELADRVAAAPDPESDEVKQALLHAVDSRELSGAAEAVQYFAHRFRWVWLRDEVERRHLDSLTRVDRRLMRHYERMLEAFSPEWEDRDLFPSLDH